MRVVIYGFNPSIKENTSLSRKIHAIQALMSSMQLALALSPILGSQPALLTALLLLLLSRTPRCSGAAAVYYCTDKARQAGEAGRRVYSLKRFTLFFPLAC